jgi:flagellar motor switch protein FliG
MTTQLTHDGLRKAAILVASLDTAAADAVLDQLSPEQARQVREIVVELEDIDHGEQRRVIDEFFHKEPARSAQSDAGVELDGRLAWLASQGDIHDEEKATSPSIPAGKPFLFLQETDTDKLVRALAHERPQTIALVLSHLSPAKSGAVLGRLPESLQAEVVHRLVDLEETDPEILREVEEALHGRLAQHVEAQRRRVAGLQTVAGILQATDGRTGLRILDNLSKGDHTLAEKLQPQQMEFEDLTNLESDVIEELIDEAGLELMLPALFGASPELTRRVLACLPSTDARVFYQKLRNPGPIRLRDVDEARNEVAKIASRINYQARS